MKQKNLYKSIAGVVIIAGGVITLVLIPGEPSLGTMLLAGGIAILVTSIINHRKYGDEPDSDERSRKIGAYGITYAWLTGILFMFGLIWLDVLGVLRLGTQNALVASILVLAFSAVIYQGLLFRKGDVN
jgi:hypothetical protein